MAGSSGLAWARAATKAGLISRGQMARWGVDATCGFASAGSTDEATEKLLGEIKQVFDGTSAREIARMAPEVLVGVLPRIYPEMLEEVHAHQDAGRPTFIVSAAGDELVELLARILYMDGGIGTRYEVGEDGRFTGELGRPVHVRRGQGRGDAPASPRRTRSTSRRPRRTPDSASDLPMLRAVGNPVVVNPDEELARLARERGLAGDALREARAAARDRGRSPAALAIAGAARAS